MNRFLPNVVTFHNPTAEELHIMQEGRPYIFPPTSYTDVQVQHAPEVLRKWKHRGIYPLVIGEDHQAAKVEALKEYAVWTEKRIGRYQRYLDVRKSNGLTDNEPRKLKQFKKWYNELKQLFDLTPQSDDGFSFLPATPPPASNIPLESVLMSQEAMIQTPVPEVKEKKSKTKAESAAV